MKPSKDGVALVVGGLFILALVFAAYNYFNNKNIKTPMTTEDSVVTQKQQGDLDGEGTTDQKVTDQKETTQGQAVEASAFGAWVANDYKPGDIKGGSYTVVRGDTLWEIAEAAYGDGSMWTKIRDANLDQIGTLPNGSRALIVPGQVLVLP